MLDVEDEVLAGLAKCARAEEFVGWRRRGDESKTELHNSLIFEQLIVSSSKHLTTDLNVQRSICCSHRF